MRHVFISDPVCTPVGRYGVALAKVPADDLAAIPLGHPLGISGARLAITTVHALETCGGRPGLAPMCVGVGQGVSLAREQPTLF